MKIPIHSIYLFGSRAKGIATENSDYDFLILIENVTDREGIKNISREITFRIHKEIRHTPFDIIVSRLRDFE